MIARTLHAALLLVIVTMPALAQEGGTYGHYTIHDTDLPQRERYADRRKVTLLRLEKNTAMVVRSADEHVRSNDTYYEYRQRSNMLWLTGVTEPDAALLLTPLGVRINGKLVHEVLFVSPRTPMTEMVEGPRMGVDVARQVTGFETVLPYNQVHAVLDSLLPALAVLFYDGWQTRAVSEPILDHTIFWEQEMGRLLRARSPAISVRSASTILGDLRRIKSPTEIDLIRRAVEISMEAHRRTMSQSREGMHEYELEAIMEYTFHRLGAESEGYPSIIGSGPNSTIVHYSSNRRKTLPGELVVMDCGAEYHGYSADITRTFPISGRFTAEQRQIYELVLRAHQTAIRACRSGAQFRKPHVLALRTIAAGLVELGIIQDEEEASKYFTHGTSHLLGLDVHDVGNPGELEPGLVLTIEPGVYIPEGSPCDPKWWNIGVRIEDDVLITDEGNEILSAALPRTAEEIENLVMSGRTNSEAR